MKIFTYIFCLIFTTALNFHLHAKQGTEFSCPKTFNLQVSSDLPKDFELFDKNIKLKFKKFSLYYEHPKTKTMLKPHNAEEFGKKPMYWLIDNPKHDFILACSYEGIGNFSISNIVLKKFKGLFKRCTSQADKRTIFCN